MLAGVVDGAVGPFAQHCSDEAFGFAVGARTVRSSASVFESERCAGRAEVFGAIAAAVVGENLIDRDAVVFEPCAHPLEEPDGGVFAFGLEDLDVWTLGRSFTGL